MPLRMMRGVCYHSIRVDNVQYLYTDASFKGDIYAGGFIATNGQAGIFTITASELPWKIHNTAAAETLALHTALALAFDEQWFKNRITVFPDSSDGLNRVRLWSQGQARNNDSPQATKICDDFVRWNKGIKSFRWVARDKTRLQRIADFLAGTGLKWGCGELAEHMVRKALDDTADFYR